jgi:putative ABC transport system permease protein
MGAHLIKGRDLREDDDLHSMTTLIDDNLAKILFGDEDPIGHHISYPPEQVGNVRGPEIVGVYKHMLQYGPEDEQKIKGGMVIPWTAVSQLLPQWTRGFDVLIRAEGDLNSLVPAVRREVQALDPELPVFNVKTMESTLDDVLSGRRFSLLLLSLFAAAALLLAAVGVYGVMSYGVVQRTREIGIRMALGARQEDVLRLVVGDGIRLAGIGIGIGILLAIALSRVLRGMLYGVSAFDPLAYAGLTVVLALVALFASWLPARRAAKVDPNIALRAE